MVHIRTTLDRHGALAGTQSGPACRILALALGLGVGLGPALGLALGYGVGLELVSGLGLESARQGSHVHIRPSPCTPRVLPKHGHFWLRQCCMGNRGRQVLGTCEIWNGEIWCGEHLAPILKCQLPCQTLVPCPDAAPPPTILYTPHPGWLQPGQTSHFLTPLCHPPGLVRRPARRPIRPQPKPTASR